MMNRTVAVTLRRSLAVARSGRFAALPRLMSSATGTAGKSSNAAVTATSGSRVSEEDVKAVADKAAASAGKSAAASKPKGQRKHLQPTGTEGAAPWSAATAGFDPTTIGRGEAVGSVGQGVEGSKGDVSFRQGQGEGGSLRGGVASARAAATPGPDAADLLDADNIGSDVAGAQAIDARAASGAAAGAGARGKAASAGKGGRKISRAQDAAAAVGGNISQPMGPVVSSAGVRRGGGAAGGGASGSGAGGGAGSARSYHTAAAARIVVARLPIGSDPVHNFSLTQALQYSEGVPVAAPGREAAGEAAAVGTREVVAAHDAAALQEIQDEIAGAPPGTAMWTLRIAQGDATASNPRAFLADAPDIIRSIWLSSAPEREQASAGGSAASDDDTLVGAAGAVNLDAGDPTAAAAAAALSVQHGAAAVAAGMANPITAVVPRLDDMHSVLQASDGNLYEAAEAAWGETHSGKGAGYDSPPLTGWVPPGKDGPAAGYQVPDLDDPEWHISIFARKQMKDAGLDPDTGELPDRGLPPQTTHASFVSVDRVDAAGPVGQVGGIPSGGVSRAGHGLPGRGYHTLAAPRFAATVDDSDTRRAPEDVLYGETDAPAKTKDKVRRFGPPIGAAKREVEEGIDSEDDPPEVVQEGVTPRMTATINPRQSGLPPNTDEVRRDAHGKPLAPGQQPTVDAAALAEEENTAPNVRASLGAEKVHVAAGRREGAGAPSEARQTDEWASHPAQPPRR